MSKKYVIDIPDDAQYILINGASENHCYTRVEQVDDLEELNSDYINEHYGELQDEAYQRGLEEGRKVGIKDGMCEAWEVARKLAVETDDGGVSISDLYKMFGTESMCTIMKNNTVYDAIAKLKAYEDKQKDSIEVGDEVIAPCGKAVVTLIETDDLVHYLYSGGDYGCIEPQKLKKTGKHYDIASILEAMRNDTSTTRTVKA